MYTHLGPRAVIVLPSLPHPSQAGLLEGGDPLWEQREGPWAGTQTSCVSCAARWRQPQERGSDEGGQVCTVFAGRQSRLWLQVVGGEQQSPAACSSLHPPVPPGPRSALGNSCSTQWAQAWLVTFCGAQRTRNRRSVRGTWAILGGQVQGCGAAGCEAECEADSTHEPPHDVWGPGQGSRKSRLQSSKAARV